MRFIFIFYSEENCALEALKYETRNEFHDKSRCAHKAASKGGWLDEICAHMRTKTSKNIANSDNPSQTNSNKGKRRRLDAEDDLIIL